MRVSNFHVLCKQPPNSAKMGHGPLVAYISPTCAVMFAAHDTLKAQTAVSGSRISEISVTIGSYIHTVQLVQGHMYLSDSVYIFMCCELMQEVA